MLKQILFKVVSLRVYDKMSAHFSNPKRIKFVLLATNEIFIILKLFSAKIEKLPIKGLKHLISPIYDQHLPVQ